MIETKLLPSPLRWAGGKSALVSQIVKHLPNKFNRYWEPMAGGAALFFAIRPPKATISDTNPDLINYYKILKDNTDEFLSKLFAIPASKDIYYNLREQDPIDKLKRAIRFAYLNRLCWNGVYRVNGQGKFNVPIGSRLPITPWKRSHLEECAKALQSADLRCAHVLDVVAEIAAGDLVFFDPPYAKNAKSGNGFNRYTSDRFDVKDHQALSRAAQVLGQSGAFVVITVAAESGLLDVYPANFRKVPLESKSLIGCSGESRRPITEYLLFSFS